MEQLDFTLDLSLKLKELALPVDQQKAVADIVFWAIEATAPPVRVEQGEVTEQENQAAADAQHLSYCDRNIEAWKAKDEEEQVQWWVNWKSELLRRISRTTQPAPGAGGGDAARLNWLIKSNLVFAEPIKYSHGNFTEIKFGSGVAVETIHTSDLRSAIDAAIKAQGDAS